MRILLVCLVALHLATYPSNSIAETDDVAILSAQATNALGIDLLRAGEGSQENSLLSPYSIQSALAMTYAGSAGITQTQMAKTLHYPHNEAELFRSFAALRQALKVAEENSKSEGEHNKKWGGPTESLRVDVANNIYVQSGLPIKADFQNTLKNSFATQFRLVDFMGDPEGTRRIINRWVEDETKRKISELLPPQSIDALTRMVLVNALYLKAAWSKPFHEGFTEDRSFFAFGKEEKKVPTLLIRDSLDYVHHEQFDIVTIPYSGGDLQFAIFLPANRTGLADFEKMLTPEVIDQAAKGKRIDVLLYLPKFKLSPKPLNIKEILINLGMPSAFSDSANFERMATVENGSSLSISNIFHKATLEITEKGTEASAATAVIMKFESAAVFNPTLPVEIHVDRPFIFAVQHRASGACLFLGRVVDPALG